MATFFLASVIVVVALLLFSWKGMSSDVAMSARRIALVLSPLVVLLVCSAWFAVSFRWEALRYESSWLWFGAGLGAAFVGGLLQTRPVWRLAATAAAFAVYVPFLFLYGLVFACAVHGDCV